MDDLVAIGKPFFKHLRLNSNGRFRIGRRNNGKGHSYNVVYNMILRKKIELLLEHYISNGATNITHSKWTKSVYFSFNNLNYRISDHSKVFNGVNILIRLTTDIEQYKLI